MWVNRYVTQIRSEGCKTEIKFGDVEIENVTTRMREERRTRVVSKTK